MSPGIKEKPHWQGGLFRHRGINYCPSMLSPSESSLNRTTANGVAKMGQKIVTACCGVLFFPFSMCEILLIFASLARPKRGYIGVSCAAGRVWQVYIVRTAWLPFISHGCQAGRGIRNARNVTLNFHPKPDSSHHRDGSFWFHPVRCAGQCQWSKRRHDF